jgi:hypothetical protein
MSFKTHLTAESGEEDNELDGVNIVSNNDEVCLLCLDESYGVVKTVLDEKRLLRVLICLSELFDISPYVSACLVLGLLGLSGGLSSSIETRLLLLLSLRAVLVQELEQLGSGVLVESVVELSDRRRDLEALVENDLLALEADIFRPLDEAGKVGLGANVLA